MRVMAKTPKKLVNFRLPPEVVFSIQEMAEVMGTSQSDVVEQAVVFFETHQGGEGGRVVTSRPASTASTVTTEQSGNDPAANPGVVRGAQNLPGIDPKYLRPDGKPMNFFERKEVDKQEHLAKIRAESTSCEPEGVNFGHDWGA
jgi:hypothetical protein